MADLLKITFPTVLMLAAFSCSDEADNKSTRTDTDNENAFVDGDGITTLQFQNLCDAPVTFRGSDIEGGDIAPGESVFRTVGTDLAPISSVRYWGFIGQDPGGEHHTLAEFTFNTDFHNFDWYNISHVDAHNLPMAITPVNRPDCPDLSCPADLLTDCPTEGQFFLDGQLVSCVSPDRDNPDSVVAQYFEAGCTDAYSWSGDDADSMAACAGEDFAIVFCPDGEGGTDTDTVTDTDSDTVSDTDSGTSAFPVDPSEVTSGGTMTFTNIGASGNWPRRLDRPSGDPACSYKDGLDTWGGQCCMALHSTPSETLSPFDEEMTLILKAIDVKQLAVYQPDATQSGGPWHRVSFFDRRSGDSNFHFTKNGDDNAPFDGDLTGDDCVWYAMQEKAFECAGWEEYWCPDDPGVNHLGWSGSKLVVFLASMTFDDAGVSTCGGDEPGHPGPWVAFVASELIRDGGRKWNGECNCYSKTGTVGDGCGEINVFEVVMDNNEWSNREFMSTGVRSFQNGHVGGSVCGENCNRNDYANNVEVVDACTQTACSEGPVIVSGGTSDGCPVWRRPTGDRFFMILLDEAQRVIQVAVIHPQNLPVPAASLLPNFPSEVQRNTIDDMIEMRLP